MTYKTKTISFRVPQDVYDFLKKIAEEKDVYPSTVMQWVISNWMKNYRRGY